MRSPFFVAVLLSSLIFNVSLFLSHVEWEQQKYPPRENGSQQSESNQPKTTGGTPSAKVQIDCDPNCSAQSADERSDSPWWNDLKEYLQKMRHDPVAGFTGLLFIATMILSGIASWQIRHSRLIERAYILGGGPYDQQRGMFQLDVGNYGKTPGELLRVQLGFCEANNVPPEPNYTAVINFRDYLPPGLRQRVIAFVRVDPRLDNPAIYGRFHFRDIFHKRRAGPGNLHRTISGVSA